MSRYPKEDLSKVRLRSIKTRKSRVGRAESGTPFEPGMEFARFVDSLPNTLASRDLRSFAANVAGGAVLGKPIIMMIGGHVIKVGLVPIIIDLLERGIVTGIAMNSAAAIHDVESSLFGETSEDVTAGIADGSFGMARETGEYINGTLRNAFESGESDIGFGEALGERLLSSETSGSSLLATCVRLGRPVSVHTAIGTDIVHQQPSMSGSITGEMSFRDFRLFCHEIRELGGGGVVMNVGSTVILPEVFLKALTVARNLEHDVRDFTTANFDMIYHYRPRVNVVERPVLEGGRGYNFVGHHEIMIPLMAAMAIDRFDRDAFDRH